MTAASDHRPLSQFSAALSDLVTKTAPSVVSVQAHRASFSGFVWKPGWVVTADEALSDEGSVTVTVTGGTRVAATIAGRDPTTDVALLRAETGSVAPLALNGATIGVGALAVVVGARDGGPVAGLGMVAVAGPGWRSMRGGEIDARIELGLSLRREAEGGIAIDTEGRVIGMTVFGPRRRVLVIPAATITRVATLLETKGKIPRGYLGLGLQPVRLDRDEGMGAMVMSVDADGPGAKAGFLQGDMITAWNGQAIGTVNALLRALGPASIGTTAAISFRRGSATRSVDLVIGERP